MKKRTNGLGQFISYLTHMSIAAWAETRPDNGRPVYPYTLATTKAERLAHVKRRQSKNGPKSGQKEYDKWLARQMKTQGPSRKMFLARTDGGYGP